MILLRKIKQGKASFDFDKIIESGYVINEQPNIISKQQFANGKRKKIISSYEDCIIKIDLSCFDGDTLQLYLQELTDGIYEYYSLNEKKLKKAEFIVTIPELTIENCAGNVLVGDFNVILEKSGGVV